jgi:hypothetical protein
MLFPILIQTNNDISKKLSRIQWIDFRPGVRGLDTIAQLLHNPKELLKALGMRPVSSQTVYSPVVTALYYLIMLLTVINVGTALNYVIDPPVSLLPEEIAVLLVNVFLLCSLAFFMVRGLTSRKGGFSNLWQIIIGLVLMGMLVVWQVQLDQAIMLEMQEEGIDVETIAYSFVNVAEYIYLLGVLITGFMFFRNGRDAVRWFPARKA